MTAPVEDGADKARRALRPEVETALIENRRDFLRFLVRRLDDADTAEDVLQQFYLRAMSRSFDLRQSESVVAWLYRVLRTTLVDHYRRETARRRQEADYARTEVLSNEGWDAELEAAICACLETLLPTLKADYADILQRVDLREAPPRDVARDLGLAPNTVRVRLHRARQAIKQSLLLACRTCAEHGCLDCDCKQPGPADGRAEEAAPTAP